MSYEYYRNRVLRKGESSQEIILNEMKKGFGEFLKVAPNKHSILIDGVETSVVIQDAKFNDEFKDHKYLICEFDTSIDIGSYAVWKNNYWLVKSKEDETVGSNQSVRIGKCNHTLKFIDSNNNLIIKPAITAAQTLYTTGVKDEKVIEIPNGMAGIQFPYDEDTKKLDREGTFVFNKTKYKITHYDETTYPGLIVLICTEVNTSTYDDKINEIADRWVEIKGGGKIDRLPWLDDQVPPVEPDPPTEPTVGVAYTLVGETQYEGEPDNEIWYNNWCKYTAKKFIDDVEVVGGFTFTLSDTKATLSEITSNSCKVKVGSISGNHIIKLTIVDTDTSEIAIEKEITIIGR